MSGSIVKSGSGVGPSGDPAPTAPVGLSTDANNLATLGSDSKILVPTSSIWNVRLRSFNAVDNPNFEVDQRNAAAGVSVAAGGNTSGWACDRWNLNKNAVTAALFTSSAGTSVIVPGTSFQISSQVLNLQLITPQATLAAGEYIQLYQNVEGPRLRELIGDVHSVSVLAWCSQAISFSIVLCNAATGTNYTFTKLCSIPANTWTLVTVPKIPIWPSSSTWPVTPGNAGYQWKIGLGAGSTYTAPSDGVWNPGVYVTSPGTTNFASLPTNTQLLIGFIQHEPGPLCTTLQDKPFTQNLQECKRYYFKTNDYATLFPKASDWIQLGTFATTTTVRSGLRFEVAMATVPTVQIAGVGGTLGQVFIDNVGDVAFSSATPTTKGLSGITLAANSAAGWGTPVLGQLQADTSW